VLARAWGSGRRHAHSRRAARQARAAGRTLDDDGVDPQMPNVRMVRDPGLGRFLTK